MKIITLFILFIYLFNYSFSQSCEPGFTYIAGVGCRSGAAPLLHVAYCEHPTNQLGYGMFLGNTYASPCPPGYNTLYNNYKIITTNTITLYHCSHWPTPNYIKYYFLIESCGPGEFGYSEVLTFNDPINTRYLILSDCISPNWFLTLTQFFEYNSAPALTASSARLCVEYAIMDPTSYITKYQAWEFGQLKCPIGYWGTLPNCVNDIDECASGTSGCSNGCVNQIGSYYCTCPAGFRLAANQRTCVDINECAEGTSGCSHTCANNNGGFTCSCPAGYRMGANQKTCSEINECAEGTSGCSHSCANTAGSFTCSCPAGYRLGANQKTCEEINECAEGTSGCAHNCANTAGGFTCSCNAGYRLGADLKSCVEINECAEGTSGCAQNCANTAGGFICGCNSGYRLGANQKACEEINECTEGTSGCSHTCANTAGSFTCSCPAGYRLGANLKTCSEIDECAENTDGCAHNCANTIGSFTCSCNAGYRLGADLKSCNEINECTEGTSGCAQVCTNTVGSFTCSCNAGYLIGSDPKTCNDIDECAANACGTATCTNKPGTYTCSCPAGYQYSTATKSCVDVNECDLGTHQCTGLSKCVNQIGNYMCSCPAGYKPTANGRDCVDINECTTGLHECTGIATCLNTIGSYNCTCPAIGYTLSTDGKSCNDINECTLGTSGCAQNCANSVGSFTCSCNAGYLIGSDSKSCDDINECAPTPTPCGGSICNNVGGSYYCSCAPGFALSANNQTCNDINECTDVPNSCQGNAICANSVGSYSCSCPTGFELTSNKTACLDINECTRNTHQCIGVASCNNLNGDYECVCPSTGYTLSTDGKSCNDINECTEVPNSCQGNAICHNAIGDYSCSCPTGFELASNKTACLDINECTRNTHQCTGVASCVNLDGDYQCVCPATGYTLSTDGKSCNDIDECTTQTHLCTGVATCLNNIGDYTCFCPATGYTLSVDGKSCNDIDECTLGTDLCTGDFTTCQNNQGAYVCSCPTGFISISNGKDCQDIDECSTNTHECIDNTFCLNLNGSYSCPCIPNYSHVSPFKCEPKPIITTFYQKPIEHFTFVVEGFNFNQDSIVTITNETDEVDCQYKSGDSNHVECTTREGLEVIGSVTVETNTLLSDPFEFVGAPFIYSYSSNPKTSGEKITFLGRNLPTVGTIRLSISSGVDCEITSRPNNESITCNVPEGSGGFNYIRVLNETVSSTDAMYITYENPIITSTSKLFTSGGILTIYGDNFGVASSEVTIEVKELSCDNVVIVSHTELTCQLESTQHGHSRVINLVVDGLPAAPYHFTFSSLDLGSCPSDCNGNGYCSSAGCVCNEGFAGIACNETSVVIKPAFPPPNPNIPSIEVGNGNDDLNGFGYKITILRIEELDFNDAVIDTIPLFNKTWNSGSGGIDNQWIFNITLDNKSYLESKFEYFKLAKNITFASSSFVVPAESIKLSFKTKQWPFQSKLNTLRVVVQTETILNNDSVDKCSIGSSVTTNYNQHVWATTENSQTGLTARFISAAELDESIPITANIEDLSDPNNRRISIIGISVPYFKSQSIIDPDFSLLLNGDGKETGDCKSSSAINWKVATGASIGAGAAVAIAGIGAYLLRQRKRDMELSKLGKR